MWHVGFSEKGIILGGVHVCAKHTARFSVGRLNARRDLDAAAISLLSNAD